MADVNAPVEQAPALAPPTRTDEQILPRIHWVPIGKSNGYLDAKKSQSNPIYKIAVDILEHTNFFRAFTASSTIPAIYIQQFWDIICYDRIDGGYKCQLDKQWFNPPTQDTLINFVNSLGYPKEVKHLSNVVTNDMFQPWRALTTIINLCLTGKTSVLQILWGVINRAHIDYAERMWEEFTQSIHTFTFTKLIIFHMQRKHKFHPRPESPLYLPTEEPILGYLKFSAKGTKREVFGMPIPNELITDDIRGADYYDAYLKKVVKHQRYLAGKEVSDPDSPTLKPAKSTKTKITKQAKPVAPKTATKKPQPAPIKPKEKKRKHAKETTEATPPAKRAKAGKVAKKRTLKKSQQLVDEFVDVEIDLLPWSRAFEADTQRAIEESLKDAHAPTEPSSHDESSSLYAKLGLTKSDTESDEEVPPVVKSGAPDKGQARPNPGIHDEGQAGPNPSNDTVSQTLSTPGVHAGPNLEHIDAKATDATSQPQQGQIDEEFTATAYPNIHENLKLMVDDPVIPEEPASSTGTLSSLQHLAKDFSFGDQFFNDKPSEANNEKATADTKAELMVSITIHQDTSVIPPMTSLMINLVSVPDSPTVHRPLPTTTAATATTKTTIMKTALEERLDKHGSRLYKLENQDIPNQVSKVVDEIVMNAVVWAMHAPLRERFRDPPEADMKEILHN
ncbi:hypothetical protein Tco_1172038 [Tanacetum coccineum]